MTSERRTATSAKWMAMPARATMTDARNDQGRETMTRVSNFSAGPAMLPEPVLRRAQAELLDWKGSGMSVMEVSHRGADFIDCAARAEASLRRLLGIPENYRVLFTAGGATAQFAAVPLNISAPGSTVDYVLTGSWGKKAAGEAARYAKVNV